MASDTEDVLYVHLADDGGIFVIWGGTGQEAWITQGRLREELGRLKARSGTVLYSRTDPQRDPPAIVERSFAQIVEAELPVKLTTEVHPDAAPAPGGATTLMAAAHAGDAEVVTDLADRGADLEARDVDGYTALMYAANAGQREAADALLRAGADANAADAQRSTPIMFAAQHGYTDLVQRLIEAGSQVDARGDHGLTALGFARQNGHRDTARVLEAAGARD